MRMLGTKIGNQLELAYLTGQAIPAGGQSALDINQLFNGWEYQISSNGGHLVDATTYANRFLSTQLLNKLIKVVPTKYRTRAMDYRFLVSPNTYQDFLALVGNRATPFGDVAYQAKGYEQNLPTANSVLGWGNIPLYVVPLMPESDFVVTSGGVSTTGSATAGTNTVTVASATGLAVGQVNRIDTGALAEVGTISAIAGTTITYNVTSSSTGNFSYTHTGTATVTQGTSDGAKIVLAHFNNLIVGIQRDIRIELDRRPRERATYAVVSLRVDNQMENPDSASMVTGLAIQP